MTKPETKKQYVHAAVIVASNRTITEGIEYIKSLFGYSILPQEFSRIQNQLLKAKVIQTVLPKYDPGAKEKRIDPAWQVAVVASLERCQTVEDAVEYISQRYSLKFYPDEFRAIQTELKQRGIIDRELPLRVGAVIGGVVHDLGVPRVDTAAKPAIVNIRRLARLTKRLVQVYGRQRVVEMLDTIDALESLPV